MFYRCLSSFVPFFASVSSLCLILRCCIIFSCIFDIYEFFFFFQISTFFLLFTCFLYFPFTHLHFHICIFPFSLFFFLSHIIFTSASSRFLSFPFTHLRFYLCIFPFSSFSFRTSTFSHLHIPVFYIFSVCSGCPLYVQFIKVMTGRAGVSSGTPDLAPVGDHSTPRGFLKEGRRKVSNTHSRLAYGSLFSFNSVTVNRFVQTWYG